MEKKNIVIGSRESKLAVIQSEQVLNYINENNDNTEATLLTMKTTGDKILDKTLDKVGGKGLFVKELDKALFDKRSDISVHSLKDMPMEVPEELPLIAYSKREDPRDVLVLPTGADDIDFSKPVGCSSFRRMLQLKELYPEIEFKSVRGNVITRLEKLDSGQYSALVLAAAGQGILAVQGRKDEDYSYLNGYNNEESEYSAVAERSFVRFLNGGCSSPVAAFAVIEDDDMKLTGLYYDPDTGAYLKGSIKGNKKDGENLGIELARRLRKECSKS